MNEADEGYFYLDSHEKWLKALENEALPFTKAVLYPSHDISDLLISRLKHMGSFEIAPSVMFGGELHNIEINRRGVNKGQDCAGSQRSSDATMENLAAIGDSDNDLTDAARAGLGIATANSRKTFV
ncbi:MAG: HAD hydrolase family protein [Butyricicoccaceae bacterium]